MAGSNPAMTTLLTMAASWWSISVTGSSRSIALAVIAALRAAGGP